MRTAVDTHSHILPGIDDGSSSTAESVQMLQEMAKQGITCAIATPHFYANYDDPERFLERRAEAAERLYAQMKQCPGHPEIKLGAEVYFFQGMSNSDVLQRLTIDQKRCILIEMPQSPWSDRMYKELEDIWTKQGLIPVVAHVDRYISRFRTHGIPQRLEQLPVFVQANASFFLQRSTRSMALRMLKNGQIHLLGSDCHNMSSRPPNLGDVVELISHRLGVEAFDRIHETESVLLK